MDQELRTLQRLVYSQNPSPDIYISYIRQLERLLGINEPDPPKPPNKLEQLMQKKAQEEREEKERIQTIRAAAQSLQKKLMDLMAAHELSSFRFDVPDFLQNQVQTAPSKSRTWELTYKDEINYATARYLCDRLHVKALETYTNDDSYLISGPFLPHQLQSTLQNEIPDYTPEPEDKIYRVVSRTRYTSFNPVNSDGRTAFPAILANGFSQEDSFKYIALARYLLNDLEKSE